MKGFKNSWIITESGKEKINLIIEEGLIKSIGDASHGDLVELPENYVVVFFTISIL